MCGCSKPPCGCVYMCIYYIYIYIYIYRERGRQKCQLAALQRIFRCSAALLAKVYTIHILLQCCYSSSRRQLSMPYNMMTLLPNSCGPIADGPFRYPWGRSYPHPKYWTHQWRIDINIDHGISPIEPSLENQGTWQRIRRHYYQKAADQWRMVHIGTPRVGPIHTANIGPIDEGLISISTIESHP